MRLFLLGLSSRQQEGVGGCAGDGGGEEKDEEKKEEDEDRMNVDEDRMNVDADGMNVDDVNEPRYLYSDMTVLDSCVIRG